MSHWLLVALLALLKSTTRSLQTGQPGATGWLGAGLSSHNTSLYSLPVKSWHPKMLIHAPFAPHSFARQWRTSQISILPCTMLQALNLIFGIRFLLPAIMVDTVLDVVGAVGVCFHVPGARI